MNFLPDDYKAPARMGLYTKLVKGENRIRILSRPVFGWEDWQDNKPVRYEMHRKPKKSIDASKPMKHFWAFVIYNYNEEQIQVMQVTQSTVIKGFENLCRDKDWGSPFGYDIKIIKTGDGVKTEYAVNPLPHKPVEPFVLGLFNERRCNLNALFSGQDPFSEESTKDSFALLASENKVVAIPAERLTVDEIMGFVSLLQSKPKEFVDEVQLFLKKQGIEKYDDLPRPVYERLVKKIKGGN